MREFVFCVRHRECVGKVGVYGREREELGKCIVFV